METMFKAREKPLDEIYTHTGLGDLLRGGCGDLLLSFGFVSRPRKFHLIADDLLFNEEENEKVAVGAQCRSGPGAAEWVRAVKGMLESGCPP